MVARLLFVLVEEGEVANTLAVAVGIGDADVDD